MVEKKPADALVLANKAINANPLSIPAQILKATALEQSGAVTEAVAALRDLLAHAPTVVEAQLQLAAIYITQRDMQGAADLAGQAVTIRPQSGLAHLLFARASLGTGNLARAESELRALAATNPQSAEIHTLLGELYVQKRDVAHARESFDKALKLQPASVEALGGMVTVLLAEKKLDAARTIIVAQLKTSPDDPNLLALAGATFQTTGDMQRAEEVFRKAVQLDPANFDAYRSLGNLYMTQHRLEEAKKEYELAASRRPEAAVGARTMVGLILEMQGKRDEARKQYEKVLELNPRAAVAANNLAWEHAEAGENLDVALQLAQTAKAQMPNNGMVSDTLGWVYYKKGLASLAVTALKDGVTQDRSNPLLHYHLGLAYAKNGNREEARRSLEQALKLDPRFAGAEDAKRVLVTLKG
jgi:tetratricopeptide (TPR) repeat protein